MRNAIAIGAALLLAACGKDPLIVEKPPEIVRIQVEVPVSLCPGGGGDCDLLRDCYNEPAKEQTYGEAKRLANLRDASIEDDCNKRWEKVRQMQPKRAPTIEGKDK